VTALAGIMQPVAMALTLADIARLAGVSKATVSRALDDSPLISGETKDRIRTLAREHRFERNESARRLTLRQSKVAGLVMFGEPSHPYRPDLFMLEIMGGVASGLHEQGYELLAVQPRTDDENWARRYVDSGRADGFIVLSASCTPGRLRMLMDSGVPFVVWGRRAERGEFSSVSGDNEAGGRLAAERLVATGRRRIAFVGGPDWAPEIKERRAGYTAALEAAGISVDPSLVVHTPWTRPEDNARAAVGALLDAVPELDGIVANSDRFAIGALDALRERGIDVPGRAGVVGYDDTAIAAYTHPSLTTVRQDGVVAGRLLARTLVDRIQTGAVTHVSMPAELVVRESA
jgi:DNA-binding LacI/PurR family transcriptional regulator